MLGQVIAQTYAIRMVIAQSETGTVYEAEDTKLGRAVALKLAAPGTAVLAEARRCAAINAACAVQIHGMGIHDGIEYVVAERAHGRLLRDELERQLPPDVYLAYFRAIVAAVVHAHEAQIAIGDISGSTVLVAPEGRLILGRLSLSQVPVLGPHGRILAPEVIKGEVDATDPDALEAIDLYGLGCVAIEMARGAPPFADEDPDVEIRGHASMAPARIVDLRTDIPSELSDLVDWLLAKKPFVRPRSARDVLQQVDAIRDRIGKVTMPLRVLIVDDDTARARWMWSLVRRAHSATLVEIASEGTDAAHKLNRDQPDIVFVDASLRGVMNALELCMYARGLESWHHRPGQMYLVGDVSERDAALFEDVNVLTIPSSADLPNELLDRVRKAVTAPDRTRTPPPRTKVTG